MALRIGFMGLWGLSEHSATTKGRYWKPNAIRSKTNECKCTSVVQGLTPTGLVHTLTAQHYVLTIIAPTGAT